VLIRDDGQSWTAITQPAHAYLAGQVARHWAQPQPADVILGVEQHDIAWSEWDREPSLHGPERRVASFYEVAMEPRLAAWTHVARRLEAQSPYAALLVSLHATNVHTRYAAAGAQPHGFLAGQRQDQDALLAVLPDTTRERAERDADLVFALDALSLVLCHGWDARDLPPVGGRAIRVAPQGDGEATLDPWPLDVAELTFGVHARRLTGRFDDEHAMRAALAATPNERRSWRLRPA
jgi:Protein of unknown function (DUF3891)